MSAAPKTQLEELHATLARELAVAVTERETKVLEVPDGDGETKKIVVHVRNAAVLNAARQFLKDNGIECAPGVPNPTVKSIVDGLPFAGAAHDGDDEDDPALRKH